LERRGRLELALEMSRVTIAVYPGSFDPVHNGHIDIAMRASQIFDRLIVAVYDRPLKNILFTAEKRAEMMRLSLSHLANVTVTRYDKMTVDFVRAQGAQVIIRGLRMAYDFDLEYQMALTNKALASDIETVCLFTGLNYAFLSSSIVKEVAAAGGDVSDMVPEYVQRALREEFL
jgi:pantetheine-phosphate adenylyltransferase